MTALNKLVVLDRDGVINYDSDDYVKTVDEWIPLPGAIEALGRLSQAGYQIAIATNQSGIARGYFSEATLNAMHEKLLALANGVHAKIDFIAYCPHGPEDNCDCRKPLPGLLFQIEKSLNVSVQDCFMVGDSLRDIQAGQAAGMRGALVLTGKGQRTLDKAQGLEGIDVFSDLAKFVDDLLKNNYL